MLLFLLFICVGSVLCDDERESRVVTIKQGSVRGYKHPDGDFFVFHSIPYATAPTGSQRFQAPLPPPIWLDTYEAVDKGIVCPQYNYFGYVFNNSKEAKENCLFANVYVPNTKEKNLPVLVNIHGGGYQIGYGDLVTPRHLAMTKRAIIVNFNYRLGAHGFLCLGTKDVPGNAGMKDQVALLRWVQDNIASFGGNPDDVTITGCSAGSFSVDLLLLSKMANNLFKKVIPESGANTAPVSVQMDPINNAKKYAKRLNFTDVDDIYALENFYKTVSYDTLLSIDAMSDIDIMYTFSPCVERDTGVERFLDDNPINILKSGNYQKRPMLYGFANMEGLFRVNLFDAWKDKMNANFADFLPADLQFENEEQKEAVAAKIKQFYFNDTPITGDKIQRFIDYYSDITFTYSTLRSTRLQVEAGNTQIYLYVFSYVDDESPPAVPDTNIRGANHCAQTMIVHDGRNLTHSDETNISEDMRNMKLMLRDMWLNFVVTGKPVLEGSSYPAWPATGADGAPYMILDKIPEVKTRPMLEDTIRFWDGIYSKHQRYPIPPGDPSPKHTEL
ncbi:juvenile hormone esterase-like [Epargyreus clarus]|uniref:juvenile hormone esterase-like n=1 Tax=Epargyreus clarus TaxID=520877 RepID=UPI003C2B687D